MANEKTDTTITVELKKSEAFQIYLSLVSRTGYAQQKWASASSMEEQKQMQNEIAYLSELTAKFSDLIK